MKFKNILQLATMVLVFAIVPLENRIFIFHSQTHQYFGELLLHIEGGRSYFITKNSSSEAIKFRGSNNEMLITQRIEDGQSFSQSNATEQYPATIAIVIDSGTSKQVERHIVQIGEQQPTKPGTLDIRTDVERDRDFLYSICLIVIAVLFAYLAMEYAAESSPRLSKREELNQQPSE